MTIEIQSLHPKQHNVAFCYSTKDRVDLSKKTLPAILSDYKDNFDLYWIDGSVNYESKALFVSSVLVNVSDCLKEIHTGVTGGADVAILYSLSLLLDKGYDYIGLIENDVLLQEGWFKRIFDLFEIGRQDGLLVGAVSARCYQPRIHIPRDGYAVMKNVGAGMILLTREAVEYILDNFHTGPVGEPSFLFTNYTGIQGICPWQMENLPPEQQTNKWYTCADWFFEASLLPYGMVTLACTPSMAKNIDEAEEDPIQIEAIKALDTDANWKTFCDRMTSITENDDVIYKLMPHYDPVYKEWRAFPHQLAKVFEDTFANGWELKWNQFYGPFSFQTTENGSRLKLRINSCTPKVIYTNNSKDTEILINHLELNNQQSIKLSKTEGMGQINLSYGWPGPHTIEITFDGPGIIIHGVIYDAPQNWFRSKYGLRYKDLASFIR